MDKGVEVAILQLEGEIEIEALHGFRELADDAFAVLHVAHVVVGHLKDEEGSGIEVVHDDFSLVQMAVSFSALVAQ
jgi:hypothetical protein